MSLRWSRFRDEVATMNEKFRDGTWRGERAEVRSLLHEVGQLLGPGAAGPLEEQGTQEFWEELASGRAKSATLEVVELDRATETASKVVRYAVFADSGELLGEGRFAITSRTRSHGPKHGPTHEPVEDSQLAAEKDSA